jgi:hypothetical protein
MLSKLKSLISSVRSDNVNITDKLFAEVVLTECERQGMLPPGNYITLGDYTVLEHVWSPENE